MITFNKKQKLPFATKMLMKRQRPVNSMAPISPDRLPTLSRKTYTPIFIGISMDANTSCVRYGLSPNPVIFRLIP